MAHRGEIVEKYLRKEHVNLTKLSDKTSFTVRTMYRHFSDPKLDLEKILEYSQALSHDFSDEIPEMAALKFQLKEANIPYQVKKDNVSEAEYYRSKYETLLEKYNEMLEKYNQVLQQRSDKATDVS